MTEHTAEPHPLVRPRLYLAVWGALMVLTSITVAVSFLDMQRFTVFTAMLIATVKASLVVLYFMHIRFVKPIYSFMILFIVATYAVFVILIFSDYSFR